MSKRKDRLIREIVKKHTDVRGPDSYHQDVGGIIEELWERGLDDIRPRPHISVVTIRCRSCNGLVDRLQDAGDAVYSVRDGEPDDAEFIFLAGKCARPAAEDDPDDEPRVDGLTYRCPKCSRLPFKASARRLVELLNTGADSTIRA